MKGRRLSAAEMAVRRQEMLAAAFRQFSERGVDSVRMADIARETGYTTRSLQRYFHSKDALVVETAVWAWERFLTENRRRRQNAESAASAEDYAFFLDSFLALYRDHRDLLRFNQFFNVYVQARHVSTDEMGAYRGMVGALRARFRAAYEKRDGTLRTDVPEEEMFSATLHLMLAAVTRYAVGLVYDGGIDPEAELRTLRDLLLAKYTIENP